MADTPAKTEYSEHASILAALTDTLPRGEASALMEKLFESPQLMRGSLQFQAYLHRAMDRQNLRERYLECLQPWRDLLAIGLTTFPEHGDENTRSDCHAWNAYPAYELFTLVAGIRIAEPGYGKVRIEPSLGGLDWLKAKLPWREGEIAVVLEQSNEGLRGSITIPEGLDAVFVWAGAEQVLSAGTNVLERRQLSEGRAVSLASD